jgi:hypothetical protein
MKYALIKDGAVAQIEASMREGLVEVPDHVVPGFIYSQDASGKPVFTAPEPPKPQPPTPEECRRLAELYVTRYFSPLELLDLSVALLSGNPKAKKLYNDWIVPIKAAALWGQSDFEGFGPPPLSYAQVFDAPTNKQT